MMDRPGTLAWHDWDIDDAMGRPTTPTIPPTNTRNSGSSSNNNGGPGVGVAPAAPPPWYASPTPPLETTMATQGGGGGGGGGCGGGAFSSPTRCRHQHHQGHAAAAANVARMTSPPSQPTPPSTTRWCHSHSQSLSPPPVDTRSHATFTHTVTVTTDNTTNTPPTTSNTNPNSKSTPATTTTNTVSHQNHSHSPLSPSSSPPQQHRQPRRRVSDTGPPPSHSSCGSYFPLSSSPPATAATTTTNTDFTSVHTEAPWSSPLQRRRGHNTPNNATNNTTNSTINSSQQHGFVVNQYHPNVQETGTSKLQLQQSDTHHHHHGIPGDSTVGGVQSQTPTHELRDSGRLLHGDQKDGGGGAHRSSQQLDVINDLLRELDEEPVTGAHNNTHPGTHKTTCPDTLGDKDEWEGFSKYHSKNTCNSCLPRQFCKPICIGGSSSPCGISTPSRMCSCSNLRCTKCDMNIETFVSNQWGPGVTYLFLRTSFPDRNKLRHHLIPRPGACARACQCTWSTVHSLSTLDTSDSEIAQWWVCAGHEE